MKEIRLQLAEDMAHGTDFYASKVLGDQVLRSQLMEDIGVASEVLDENQPDSLSTVD